MLAVDPLETLGTKVTVTFKKNLVLCKVLSVNRWETIAFPEINSERQRF